MTSIIQLPEVRELGENLIGAFSLDVLNDITWGMVRRNGKEEVNMIRGYLPCDDLPIVLGAYLTDDVAGVGANYARQDVLPIRWDPNEMNANIVLCVGTAPIVSFCHIENTLSYWDGATS